MESDIVYNLFAYKFVHTMTKEEVLLFLDSLKSVLAYDIIALFKKTEKKEENVYERKYNTNIEIIEEAINKDDDDTQLFLICLKSVIDSMNPDPIDVEKLKSLFSKVDLDFCFKMKMVMQSFTPNKEDLEYVLTVLNIDLTE